MIKKVNWIYIDNERMKIDEGGNFICEPTPEENARIRYEKWKKESQERCEERRKRQEERFERRKQDNPKKYAVKKRRRVRREDKKLPPEIREEVLKRDGYACRKCGSKENLQIHHIKYRSKGGSDDLNNLITLCEFCHWIVHKDEPVGKIMHKRLVRHLKG